jgi:hypothetical protein
MIIRRRAIEPILEHSRITSALAVPELALKRLRGHCIVRGGLPRRAPIPSMVIASIHFDTRPSAGHWCDERKHGEPQWCRRQGDFTMNSPG